MGEVDEERMIGARGEGEGQRCGGMRGRVRGRKKREDGGGADARMEERCGRTRWGEAGRGLS